MLLPKDITSVLEEHYEVPNILEGQVLINTHTFAARVGDHKEYVVRRTTDPLRTKAYCLEKEITDKLRGKFITPTIFSTKEGKPVFTKGKHCYTLMSFLEGTQRPFAAYSDKKLSPLIDYYLNLNFEIESLSFSELVSKDRSLKKRLNLALEKLKNSLGASINDIWIKKTLEIVKKCLNNLDFNYLKNSPSGITHGDFNEDNVLFYNKEIKILDFLDLVTRPHVEDLAWLSQRMIPSSSKNNLSRTDLLINKYIERNLLKDVSSNFIYQIILANAAASYPSHRELAIKFGGKYIQRQQKIEIFLQDLSEEVKI